MKTNSVDWINNIINQKEVVNFPLMTNSGIELIGKKVIDAVTNGEVHYEAVKILAEKYPSIASSVIMDLTVESESFGAEISFTDNDMPNVIGRLVKDEASIDALQIPDINTGRMPEYIKANKLISENVNKPIFAGCTGPFSLAGRLYGITEFMMGMYINPDEVKKLLDKCTDFIIKYCNALKAAGSNGVVVAEPVAGLLSNDACKEFSSVYVKRIVEEVQDDSFAVFLHNCGNKGQCTEAMVYTGAMGYHFGNEIDMVQALKDCPSDVLVMGNIDPVGILKLDIPDEVYNETIDLLNRTSEYPNFVMSSGCDTPPRIPFENIDKYFQAVIDYNKKL